jgi:hypothetical protein
MVTSKKTKRVEKSTSKSRINIPRALKKKKHVFVPETDLSGQPLVGKELDRRVNRQIEDVANPLMKHYGISLQSPHRWRYLCWCLLQERGLITFAPPREPLRRRVWKRGRNKLVERVDEVVAKGRLTVSAAIAHVRHQYPEYQHLEQKSLANRYYEAKRALDISKHPLGLWPLEMRLKYLPKE